MFRNQSEFILIATRGSIGKEQDRPRVFPAGVWREYLRPGDKMHLTGKPVNLMTHLMSVLPADSCLLDPFAGSGTTLLAARQLATRPTALSFPLTMPVSPETGWQHPPTSRGDSADASPLRAESDPESVERVSHMGQMTLSEFQVSPFQGIMCVNAPVTLSSPLNNLVISRLFNLLQPISTLFNYLCLVTLTGFGSGAGGAGVSSVRTVSAFRFRVPVPAELPSFTTSKTSVPASSAAAVHSTAM